VTPGTQTSEPKTVAPADARAFGVPAPGPHGDARMVADLLDGLDLPDLGLPSTRPAAPAPSPGGRSSRRLHGWARERWAGGGRLDPGAAVRAGAAGTAVGAAVGLTGWLVLALTGQGVRACAADLVAAGVVDDHPPAARTGQAAWLLTQVRGQQGSEAPGEAPGGCDPRRLDIADFVGVAGGARSVVRRGAHADAAARAVLAHTPTRAQEVSDLYVAAAIPPEAVRAGQAIWRQMLGELLVGAGVRVDGADNVVRVAAELSACADWVTCTSRPGWARLAAAAGVCERTVGRALARLRGWRLLAGVLGGRTARFARTAADAGTNRAAVYVLLVPKDSEEAGQGSSVSPSPAPAGGHPTPVRARGEEPRAGPLRGAEDLDGAAARRRPGTIPGTRLDLPRPVVRWPAYRVPVTKAERADAALDLRWRMPVLRGTSTADVASRVRAFHLAGWTVADLAVAIDGTPDSGPQPHSGAEGVRHPGGWLTARLAPWLAADGAVLASPGQRAQAARARARARAAAERRHDDPRSAAGPGPTAGYLACRAALSRALGEPGARPSPAGGARQ
jgi:hypothetical protein